MKPFVMMNSSLWQVKHLPQRNRDGTVVLVGLHDIRHIRPPLLDDRVLAKVLRALAGVVLEREEFAGFFLQKDGVLAHPALFEQCGQFRPDLAVSSLIFLFMSLFQVHHERFTHGFLLSHLMLLAQLAVGFVQIEQAGKENRDDQKRSDDDRHQRSRDLHQPHPELQIPDEERSEEHAPHRSLSTGDRNAAEHDQSDDFHIPPGGDVGADREDSGCQQNGGKAADEAGDREVDDPNPLDVDSAEPSDFGVVSDRIEPPAIGRLVEDEAEDHHEHEVEHELEGDRGAFDELLTEKPVGFRKRRSSLVAEHSNRDSPVDRLRRQRHGDRRHLEERDHESVEKPRQRTHSESDEDQRRNRSPAGRCVAHRVRAESDDRGD